jgi:predicted MPP superfamily phosphohydrolase
MRLSTIVNGVLVALHTLGHAAVGVWLTNRFLMGAPETRYKPLLLVGHPALWTGLGLLNALRAGGFRGFARSLFSVSWGALWRALFTFLGGRYVAQELYRARHSRLCPTELLSTRAEDRDLREHVFRHDGLPTEGLKGLINRANQLYNLEVVTHEVALPNLPRAFDGFSLVQITDPHLGPSISSEFMRCVVQTTLEMSPDVVALTGDYQSYSKDVEGAARLLRPLGEWSRRERDGRGAFAVLGNHDRGSGTAHVIDALRRAGIRVLNNRHVELKRDGASLYLVGIADPWSVRNDLDIAMQGVPEGGCVVLLAHVPDFLDETGGAGVALQLSGHNHGGQIKVPVLGPVLVSSRYGRRYTEGWFKREGTLMYVSRGLGGKPAIRVGTRPELTSLVLRAM